MILASHAVVGAVLGKLVPQHPIAAFFLGFLSHFVFDSIPHWQYSLKSLSKNVAGDYEMPSGKKFNTDMLKVGIDILSGLAIVVWFLKPLAFGDSGLFTLSGVKVFTTGGLSVLAGAFGGMLPDGLQFLYFKIKREPFLSLQRFHNWIHAEHDITAVSYGVVTQIAIVLAVSLLGTY